MQGRKIMFRAVKPAQSSSKHTRSSDEPTGNSDRSTAHVSQSLKTTAAAKRPRPGNHLQSADSKPGIVFRLVQRSEAPTVPAVSEISRLNEDAIVEVGQMRLKSIPDKFRKCESVTDVKGEVFGAHVESRSPPPTPLVKSHSLDKKHDHEDRSKQDAFDEGVDALFNMALDLKSLTKSFLPERDSARLEQKLREYCDLLRHLEGITKEEAAADGHRLKKEKREVPLEMWTAMNDGVHPDTYLTEQSDALLEQAQHNVQQQSIIDTFLQLGTNLTSQSQKGTIKTEATEAAGIEEASDPVKQ